MKESDWEIVDVKPNNGRNEIKLQGKFGPENMFVLTARPPAAQKAIFDFLKANGLNIPIKNITGLGNSTSEAKALWIADKVTVPMLLYYVFIPSVVCMIVPVYIASFLNSGRNVSVSTPLCHSAVF